MVSSIKNNYMTHQMQKTQNTQAKASKQLSSGYKVNSAADDAAALAISEKMKSQINSLKAYSSNYTSKILSNRVADGAMNEVSDIYNDMYANSIRAMNGTMSESDVADIKQNNSALKDTATQITQTTKYNEDFVLSDVDTNFDEMAAEAISGAASDAVSKRSELGAEENALEHAVNVNDISAENTTAALSRKIDTQMEKAITSYRTSQAISAFQNKLMSDQLGSADGIVTKMM